MNTSEVNYRAAWVLPIVQPPIRNGVVRVTNGLITAIEESSSKLPNEVDLGDSVLMPALVNAHTHLEFSELDSPLGKSGMQFTDWIQEVVDLRRKQAQGPNGIEAKESSIRSGIEQSISNGVGLLGEISTRPICQEAYRNDALQITAFLERLGRNPQYASQCVNSLESDICGFDSLRIPSGISPHAPYSVSDDLFEALIASATENSSNAAMHLAETKEELELLDSQTGPFVELLKKLGAWFPNTYRPGQTILGYLKRLAQCKRSLVVHGNYLNPDELDFVGEHADRMSIVYCPRTHEYFGHDPYPLAPMRDRSIVVAVGTDSRASNPNLSIWEELRKAAEVHADVAPEEILKMGTLNGAIALGETGRFGSLAAGMPAKFCRLEVKGIGSTASPLESLLRSSDSENVVEQISLVQQR